MLSINFQKWEKYIKKPTWYLDVKKNLHNILELKEKDNARYCVLKQEMYDFFEKHLIAGDISLGITGKDWDAERKPIDTVVIHHTHNEPGMQLTRLSAIELIRLYAVYYADPYDKRDRNITGEPIYSGHFRYNKQIFWPYHWMVRKKGKIERLLNDNETGWQSGNWDINCRSVAIVLDNDYEDSIPPEDELNAIAEIIRSHYSHVAKERIFGHREINIKTTCPSNFFLSQNGVSGWKDKVLGRL